MSLLIHGPKDLSFRLSYLMLNYAKLCELEAFDSSTSNLIENESFPLSMNVNNKYYSANLTLKFLELFDETIKTIDLLDEYEGIVLIQSPQKPLLSDDVYRLGKYANEKELNLRLLIKFQEPLKSQESSEDDIYWAVDNGFELIEINESNLIESFDSRDKIGLPRLIEALEANMWSTAQRQKIQDKIVDSKPLDHPQSSLESNQNKSNSDTDDKRNYQFMLDDEDDEDDMALFNNFALAMSQAKEIRENALTGNLSDDQRRNQAAEMMMKLAQILKLDDTDDDDDN